MANQSITTVAAYLDTLSREHRVAVEKLINIVKAAAPQLEEGLSYSVPNYKLNGKPVIGIAAAKTHTGLYVMSKAVIKAFSAELKVYDTAKGSIRFPLDAKLPAALIKRIVKARVAEVNPGLKK